MHAADSTRSISATSSKTPVATAMTRSYASSLVRTSLIRLTPTKANVAANARRLFPSTSGWLRASECSKAAAFKVTVGYASTPMPRPEDEPPPSRGAQDRVRRQVRRRVAPREAVPRRPGRSLAESLQRLGETGKFIMKNRIEQISPARALYVIPYSLPGDFLHGASLALRAPSKRDALAFIKSKSHGHILMVSPLIPPSQALLPWLRWAQQAPLSSLRFPPLGSAGGQAGLPAQHHRVPALVPR